MNDRVFEHVPAVSGVLTVLCVDDEANILNALRRLLRRNGCQVLTASSGAEGLAILADTPVDLVLSDMRMPEMDGARFLQEVRARSPESMRILLTGFADLSSTISAINDAGIFRYISKPWDDKALVTVVQDALELKLLKQERIRLEALTQQQNHELTELNATLERRVEARTAELATALADIGEAHNKLKKGFITSIRVFSNLIELREGATAGHSRHIADLARRLAQRMKCSEQEINDVTLAGLLHGIGEFGLSDAVLRKPFVELSRDERAMVVKHPLKGETALMALEQLAGVGKLIRSYRESYDGTGYPDSLSGAAIPRGARILSIAHDYEAAQEGTLTGQWQSKLQAREYILAGRGTRYDPVVVDNFLNILEASGVRPVERSIGPRELQIDMVLSRDLMNDGLLLLAKDSVLDGRLIEMIRRYESPEGRMSIYVRI